MPRYLNLEKTVLAGTQFNQQLELLSIEAIKVVKDNLRHEPEFIQDKERILFILDDLRHREKLSGAYRTETQGTGTVTNIYYGKAHELDLSFEEYATLVTLLLWQKK